MPTDSNRPDVAVFIDFENVYVSVRDKLDANPNFESIMDRCEDFGRVVIARAYADWYRYPRVTSALYANSIEPIYVPTYYYDRDMGRTGRAIKNSVDMNLCIDAMKTLFTHTNIAKFVLATGDRDFIPLVNSIRQQGKEVIIIGVGGAASSHLAQSADEFIFYETLVGKKPAGELHKDQPRAKMPEKGREQPETEEEPEPPREKEPVSTSPDVYDVLVQAIHLARERGYVCSFGSLKLLMKELMGGEFKENRYKDGSGRPFAKFKDFVIEAERRGKVQVFTSGTVNEVFLPGEDPYTLSQFAQDLKEEPGVAPAETPASEARIEARPGSTNGRRRRRRARGGQRPATSSGELSSDELFEDNDENGDDGIYGGEADPLVGEVPIERDADDQDDELFETLVELVEDEQEVVEDLPSFEEVEQAVERAEPAEEVAESASFVEALESGGETNGDAGEPDEPGAVAPTETIRSFEQSEWDVLRDIVSRFERPVAFNQIHNALREARNSAGINRTNEELRTLIKQAINTGVLLRSGKGSQIVYRLQPSAGPVDAPELDEGGEPGDTPDLVELIEGAEPEGGQTEASANQPEFHTPDAATEAQRMDETADTPIGVEAPQAPVVIAATDSTLAEQVSAKPSRSRSRRKPATQPAAEAAVAEAPAPEQPAEKPKRRRAKKTEPVAEAAPVEAPVAEEAPKPKRARRKKAEAAEQG
ncbi:MAG TPA: NYN domain-containing protein [Roseiflexaceae bacterium]|nr:NYN domain-containing protein [Roseiflexaceae bacterium]